MRHQLHVVVPTTLALICGASLIVGLSTPAKAKAPPVDPGFPHWRVQVITGNDDLRGDSEAWVTLRIGPHSYECRLKDVRAPGFPAHSDRANNCDFAGTDVLRADLSRAIATVPLQA